MDWPPTSVFQSLQWATAYLRHVPQDVYDEFIGQMEIGVCLTTTYPAIVISKSEE